MVKKILTVFLLLTIFLFPKQVFAADKFSSSYDIIFDVDNTGTTTVNEKVTLKNLTDDYYADQFNLTIGSTQISEIAANDSSGPLNLTSTKTDSATKISVKFNQQVVGLDKEMVWNLQYKTKDFAEKTGKIWEIRAPKISSSLALGNYSLKILVPTSFGEPTSIVPKPASELTEGNKIVFVFKKEQLLEKGVSASFGSFQIFKFNLAYHLENTNIFPILTSIPIPPDTAYQDISFQNLNPKPLNVTIDEDGNYLAWYKLSGNEKVDVVLTGLSRLYLKSKIKDPILDNSLREKYLQAQEYWEKDSPAIKEIVANLLKQNPKNNNEKIYLIHKYVVNSLKYDKEKVGLDNDRLGALGVLQNPTQAVCQEFTDLFIALARAAGIPARELDGYSYTGNQDIRPLSLNKDILHAWPEYWDEARGWIMVDPTWENTTGGVDYFNKLDLAHFVLAIRGVSSEIPVAAGAYKRILTKSDGEIVAQDSKDVIVDFSDMEFSSKPSLNVDLDMPSSLLAGIPLKLGIKVSNNGTGILPLSAFKMGAKDTEISNIPGRIGPIPPFGHISIDSGIKSKTLFDTYQDTINILVGSFKYSKEINVKPFVLFQTGPMIILGAAVTIFSVYFIILGVFIYRKRFLKKEEVEVISKPMKNLKPRKKV